MSGDPHDLARELLHGGRADLVERVLRPVLAADPEDAEAHALLALALSSLGKPDAVREAREAMRLAPHDPVCLHALAEAHVWVTRGPAGEAAARAALAADPGHARLHGLLSVALLHRAWRSYRPEGPRAEALRAAEAGLALDPGDLLCLLQRAQALLALGRVDEARAASAAALRERPDASGPHGVRGVVELASGQTEEARARLRDALRIRPDDTYAREYLTFLDGTRRDTVAVVLQAREWGTLVRVVMAVLALGAAVGIVRGGPARALAFFPLVLLAGSIVVAWWVPRGRAELLEELRVPGALSATEQRWARRTVEMWVLAGVALAIVAAVV